MLHPDIRAKHDSAKHSIAKQIWCETRMIKNSDTDYCTVLKNIVNSAILFEDYDNISLFCNVQIVLTCSCWVYNIFHQ